MNQTKPFAIILASIGSALLATSTFAVDPEVTPYRPGAGSPAVLSAAGYFELEAGYDYAKVSPLRSDSVGLLLKYGLSDTFGLLVGVNPYVRVSAPGVSDRGISDSLVGLKWVNKLNEGSAVGAQLITSLPTGSKGFGSDKPNVTLTGLVGFDFSGMHSDLNLGVTRVGDVVTGVSRHRVSWSASLGRPLSGPISGALEISGSKQSGAGSSTQYLGSLAYAVNTKLVLDAYYAHVRSSGISGNGFGLGMTYLFAK